MKALSMKHLRYFDALARMEHFGRAAEACRVSQPALSVQIRDLEALLGAPLVERGARRVRLTGLGAQLLPRVQAILREVDGLGDLARTASGPLIGPLRLGVIPTVAPYLLPRLIGHLGAALPALEVRPREAITQKLLEDLHEGRLDAAIVALPVSEPALAEAVLLEEEFVLVRPPSEADRPVPSAETLRTMRLLLLEEGHCFRDQAISFCRLTQGAPRDLMEGSSLSTLVQMVGAGIGVTLIPEMAVGVETRGAPVVVQRFETGPPARTLGMIWRRSSPLGPELRDLAEVVRQSAEAMYAAMRPA